MFNRNRHYYIIGFISMALSLALWNCNTTEVGKNTVLNLTVSDSLSKDKGNYDSIRVDLMDSAKLVFRPAIFSGAYITTEHPGGLHFELGNNVPAIVLVVITGHRKDGKLLISSITFENGNSLKVEPIFSTTPTGVRIQPDGPVTLSALGDSVSVTAQVLPIGATAKVIWTSLDTNTAKIQNGFVVPKMVGNTQIIATVENTFFKDTLKVNVATLTRPDSVRLNIHSLSLALGVSDTLLMAKVSPDSLQARGLVWKSSDNTVATVSATGVVKVVATGHALIVVNPSGFSGISDTCHLTVSPRVPTQPDSLRLNLHSVTLFLGESDTLLSAQIFAAQFQSMGAVWSSSDTNVATVSILGVVKAKTAGKTLISAAITGFAGIFDTCRVTVMLKPTVQPDSIRLKSRTLTLTMGTPDSLLQAKIFPDSLNRLGFIWRSSDTTVVAVNNAGLIKAVSEGKVLVTVYPTGFSGIFDTCRITILPKPISKPDSIRVSLRNMSLFVGGVDSTLTAKIFPDSLNRLGAVWKSSDSTVAKFVAGKVKPMAAGNAFIIASPTGHPSTVDTCRVTIMPKPISKPDSVRLNARTMTLFVGGPDSTLTAKISPDSLTRLGFVWNSSDTTFAKVAAGKVKAIAAGNAFIIVSPTGFAGTVDTCRVTVKKDVPTLTAGPDRSVLVGGQLTFNLKVVQEFGGVAALKWDLDGDNVYDDSVKADTAAPKRTYPAAGNFTAHFYVRDGEGNIVTTSLMVHVGSAPLVIITSPVALDTTVNLTPITIKYTVNGTSFTKSVALLPGPNPVVIDSITPDGRGYDSLMVNLDTTPPSTPIFTGTTGSFTTLPQPTWAWTSPAGGGGNGTYRIQLDANPVITQTAKSYQPSALSEASHTLTLQERDAAGNWSTPPASFVWKVDLTAPTIQITAPISSGNYLTRSASVHVAGTASDLMGLASITYVLTGATVDSTLAAGTTTWSFDMTPKEGVTTVKVIAKDLSGRTATASITVTSDKTKPTVTLDAIANDVKITSKDIPVGGTASDAGGLDSVFYRLNTSPTKVTLTLSSGRFSFTPACPDGDCSVIVLAVDKAGNRDSQTVVIYKRNNVIFVRKGKTGGDGSSWAKAFGELSDVFYEGSPYTNGSKVWVGAGSYYPKLPNSLNFGIGAGSIVLGDFKNDGSQFNPSQRLHQIDISYLKNDTNCVVQLGGDNIVLDGFKITNTNGRGILSPGSDNVKIIHCSILNNRGDPSTGSEPLYLYGTFEASQRIYMDSCFVQNNVTNTWAIAVGSANLEISNTTISDNNSEGEGLGSGIFLDIGTIFSRKNIFIKNKGSSSGEPVDVELYIGWNSSLDIDDCTITGGRDGIQGIGTVLYGSGNRSAP